MFGFITGYIRLKISAKNISSIVNKCKSRNICLYNIRHKDDAYYIDVKGKSCRSVMDIAADCGAVAEHSGRIGLLMRLVLYKSRKAFIIAVLILMAYYAVNYCYISEIEINGNEIFTDSQILSCLKENDLYPGRLKFGIDPLIFQNNVIQSFPEISWVWLRIDGTKAIVDMKERTTKPEFYNYNSYGNIVALKDGVIKSAVASRGKTLVSEGMFVKKGDILINGVYGSETDTRASFVKAEGKVMASTRYHLEDEFTCTGIKYIPHSDVKNRYSVIIGNIRFPDNAPSGDLSVILEEKDVKFKIFGKKYLPLAFTKTKYCEIIRSEYTLSYEQALNSAYNELQSRLKQSFDGEVSVCDIKKNATPLKDGKFTASITAECIEDIAGSLPIEVVAE